MMIKRALPLLVLTTLLLLGITACSAGQLLDTADPAAETAPSAAEPVVDSQPQVAVKQEAVDQAAVVVEPGEDIAAKEQPADLPGFVPPQPLDFDTSPEAVAFFVGDPDAPVEIIEFTDYQCPFCQRHSEQTLPALLENLVESGRANYAIKDLPLTQMHPQAEMASVAARCAGEQEAYLPMHDAIFAAQQEWSGRSTGIEDYFGEMAADLDLDTEAFAACLSDGVQAANVQNNINEAMQIGVGSTPIFFVNGYPLRGAQPYEVFAAVTELAENGELGDVLTVQARAAYEEYLAQQQQPQQQFEPVDVALDNVRAIGDPDAPVTIVEYTDYQCPFCSRHTEQTFPQIVTDLVQSGQVQYVFKDMPLTAIHPQAMLASSAARCAAEQEDGAEQFVAMHKLLFERQGDWSGRSNAAELFTAYAEELGVDAGTFSACLESGQFDEQIMADMQEAAQLGINGTPAFVINGYPVMGAQPYSVFAEAVETLIAAAEEQPAGS